MTAALVLDEPYAELGAQLDSEFDSSDDGRPDSDHESGRAGDPTSWFDASAPGRSRYRSAVRTPLLESMAAGDLARPVDDLATRSAPPLPVAAALGAVLPQGLRRGTTVSVTRSVSLLLAVLGGPSAAGAWCALVGMPPISAEAAVENGIELSRLALVPTPGTGWLTAVGALLDAVEIVVVRPPAHLSDSDIRRLAARARSRGSILMPYLNGPARWPRPDVALDLDTTTWTGVGAGHGRLRARQVTVRVTGRGSAGRPLSTTCWLPSVTGAATGLSEADLSETGLAPDPRQAVGALRPMRRAG